MKRHKSLIPLSQDHHNGLMLAQLIKKDSPEYKGLPRDIDGKIGYVVSSWQNELKYHFENEEKILFPKIVGKNPGIDDLLKEIINEHDQIEKMIFELEGSKNKISDLNKLGILLEKHIRKEERQLFQLIQKHLTVELNDLEGKIPSAKKSCYNQKSN